MEHLEDYGGDNSHIFVYQSRHHFGNSESKGHKYVIFYYGNLKMVLINRFLPFLPSAFNLHFHHRHSLISTLRTETVGDTCSVWSCHVLAVHLPILVEDSFSSGERELREASVEDLGASMEGLPTTELAAESKSERRERMSSPASRSCAIETEGSIVLYFSLRNRHAPQRPSSCFIPCGSAQQNSLTFRSTVETRIGTSSSKEYAIAQRELANATVSSCPHEKSMVVVPHIFQRLWKRLCKIPVAKEFQREKF